mmetsp:Transcript_26147/g.102501  ORF Transcript_26147/g.102501 Transcript_26147/m.102501 type:complete len:239 (-) Transcript_26147:1692-2408(-)|eukprot:CAMPEP_0113958558 /NCGR_PEP_ID=MMETSP0011_2-20120614/3523_1 /TAXON_ID=101924 /ORGANISM="Rhodosorus marinus" /LENGTH=238 /DNA_ID=CAMNT_0000969507 /DNA_START=170 /DNA_END=886 /DNA_ORIENTATION=+ /assembly_acc=CAM_ASM_000156
MGNRASVVRTVSSHLFEESHKTLCVILLNHELPSWTPALWERAQVRLCADGGANRLSDQFPSSPPPMTIIGDLDSIRKDVLDEYCKQGTTVVNLSHDQDSTDMQKCVRHFLDSYVTESIHVVALGGLGGRIDHTISNLSNLLAFSQIPIVLVGDGNAAFLLRAKEKSRIEVDTANEGPGCGLIPFGGPARVTSDGLKWNLSNDEMKLGALISTSNEILSPVVEVDTDGNLLWIFEVDK